MNISAPLTCIYANEHISQAATPVSIQDLKKSQIEENFFIYHI
jgi:hypothetical protein